MLAQVSMDGSNVNWKTYDKMVEERGDSSNSYTVPWGLNQHPTFVFWAPLLKAPCTT